MNDSGHNRCSRQGAIEDKCCSRQGLQQTRAAADKDCSRQRLQQTMAAAGKGYSADKSCSRQGLQQTRATADNSYIGHGAAADRGCSPMSGPMSWPPLSSSSPHPRLPHPRHPHPHPGPRLHHCHRHHTLDPNPEP